MNNYVTYKPISTIEYTATPTSNNTKELTGGIEDIYAENAKKNKSYYPTISLLSSIDKERLALLEKRILELSSAPISTTVESTTDNEESTNTDTDNTQSVTSLGTVKPGKVSYNSGITTEGLKDSFVNFLDLLAKEGLSVRVTSTFRKGATTDNGSPSRHSSGEAVDLVPEGMSYGDFIKALRSKKNILDYMVKHKINIYDEELRPQGSKNWTGAHFHFGLDSTLVASTKRLLGIDTSSTTSTKNGGIINRIQSIIN